MHRYITSRSVWIYSLTYARDEANLQVDAFYVHNLIDRIFDGKSVAMGSNIQQLFLLAVRRTYKSTLKLFYLFF